ncbi:MAG: CvpA family protein [Bacteroidales bacterium]|nr:CvpA family protein [Bacteroidales bacterium]
MGTIDIIILVCLMPALYFGLKNGLVKQIISFAVIYLGITLALKFSGAVVPLVQQYIHVEGFWAKFIAFVAIFAAVALVLTILGNIIEKAIKAGATGFLNRVLGLLLALFIFILLTSLLVYLADSLNQVTGLIPEEKLAESKLYPIMLDIAKTFFPYLKSLF